MMSRNQRRRLKTAQRLANEIIMNRGFQFRGGYGRGMRPRVCGSGLMETHASLDDFPKKTTTGSRMPSRQ